MVPLFGADGTANFLDLTSPLPTWADLINEVDATKRWFPLPNFENVEMPKADSQFEEANSGRMVFLRQGKRSFAGELWADDSTPTLLGKLQNNRCVDFGVYIVDINGNLVGSKVGTDLYPIAVDNPSFNPTFTFATDSTTQKIMLGFDFDRLFDESTMYMITPTEAGINFNDLTGLIDVNLTATTIAAGSLTFTAALDYGTALNPITYSGALSVDWTLTANGVAVTPLTVTESLSTIGEYVATYTTGAPGDAMILSVSKSGFDGEVSYTEV